MKKTSQSSPLRRGRQAECEAYAAKIRAARAVLRWSQTELGKKAQITQRAIHRLEKAAVEARHRTQMRIDEAFKAAGIVFAELPNGGFELIVPGHVLANGAQTTTSQGWRTHGEGVDPRPSVRSKDPNGFMGRMAPGTPKAG